MLSLAWENERYCSSYHYRCQTITCYISPHRTTFSYMTDEPIEKSIPASQDDVVRNVRFKRETWDKLIELTDLFDRSPNFVVNKLVNDYKPGGLAIDYPVKTADGKGPISTYILQVEFQMPSREDCDDKAYELLENVTDHLRVFALNDAVYGRIDAIRPMMTRATGKYADEYVAKREAGTPGLLPDDICGVYPNGGDAPCMYQRGHTGDCSWAWHRGPKVYTAPWDPNITVTFNTTGDALWTPSQGEVPPTDPSSSVPVSL